MKHFPLLRCSLAAALLAPQSQTPAEKKNWFENPFF